MSTLYIKRIITNKPEAKTDKQPSHDNIVIWNQRPYVKGTALETEGFAELCINIEIKRPT